jgi:hypothetical protein
MMASDCFAWCFERSVTPVLPPFPLPVGTIYQTKEVFSMAKCPDERRIAYDIYLGRNYGTDSEKLQVTP